MGDTVPSLDDDKTAARQRLAGVLQPRTDDERRALDSLDAVMLAMLAERAVRRAFADGAEVGRHEVVEQESRRHQSSSDSGHDLGAGLASWGDL